MSVHSSLWTSTPVCWTLPYARDVSTYSMTGANWSPSPVGSFPQGESAWGLLDTVGNLWQWTSSPFAPFPGFEAYVPSYPGYSADFFDDRHFVMLGASWATPTPLIRRSFRNWFQDRYPYAFAGFRTVRAD